MRRSNKNLTILQSGTALGTQWGQALTPEHAVEYGNLLSGKLGCDEEEDVLQGILDRLTNHYDMSIKNEKFNWIKTRRLEVR